MLYSDFSLTVIALGWVLPISSKGQLLKVTLLFLKGATKKIPLRLREEVDQVFARGPKKFHFNILFFM